MSNIACDKTQNIEELAEICLMAVAQSTLSLGSPLTCMVYMQKLVCFIVHSQHDYSV